MIKVKRGQKFIHARQLDTDWKPGPGQKYKDAPKRRMVVTAVIGPMMYYRGDDRSEPWTKPGAWAVSVEDLNSVVGEWL